MWVESFVHSNQHKSTAFQNRRQFFFFYFSIKVFPFGVFWFSHFTAIEFGNRLLIQSPPRTRNVPRFFWRVMKILRTFFYRYFHWIYIEHTSRDERKDLVAESSGADCVCRQSMERGKDSNWPHRLLKNKEKESSKWTKSSWKNLFREPRIARI